MPSSADGAAAASTAAAGNTPVDPPAADDTAAAAALKRADMDHTAIEEQKCVAKAARDAEADRAAVLA